MGIPSPRKLFWVIGIEGSFVRFEGFRTQQYPIGPTFFETNRAAMAAASHIWVGHLHVVQLQRVTRAWLESIAKGEKQVKVDVYRTQAPVF
jgi:hypothetical protein